MVTGPVMETVAPLVVKHLDVIEQLHLRLAKTGEAISEPS
jgi:hypothetical protein